MCDYLGRRPYWLAGWGKDSLLSIVLVLSFATFFNMPKRRRRFDRSKAVTFEVVYKPLRDSGEGEHVLRRVGNDSSDPAQNDAIDGQTLPYCRDEYELGEFGLPSDGYDYMKHFRTIGGTGGVLVSAAGTKVEELPQKPSFLLRDSTEKEAESAETEEAEPIKRREEDEQLRAKSIAEIQRLRNRIPDLDDVFAELDSDGELLEDDEEAKHTEKRNQGKLSLNVNEGSDGDLPDDFIQLANCDTTSSLADENRPEAPMTRPARQPTALDDQFEKLLKSYEEEFDEEEDDEMDEDEEGIDIAMEDLDPAELAMLNDLHGLDLEDSRRDDEVVEVSTIKDDSFEPDAHAEQELTTAMDKLFDSKKRVTADEAFAAFDGAAVAKKAIEAAEHAEKERLLQTDGFESDSNDSELDCMLNSVDPSRELWDCETIVSTYTNLDNHPSVVDEDIGTRRRNREPQQPVIRLDPRTQLPIGAVPDMRDARDRDLTEDFGARRKPAQGAGRARVKDESKEEKRLRKAAVKSAARSRRKVKKEMKLAFGAEAREQGAAAAAQGESKIAVHF